MLFRRQNARRGCKLRACDGPANRAGRDFDLRIVANPLGFAHRAAGHHVEFAVFFAKPHRGRDARAVFTKRGQRDVILSVDGCRNLAWHSFILEAVREESLHRDCFVRIFLSFLVHSRPGSIAPVRPYVLKA